MQTTRNRYLSYTFATTGIAVVAFFAISACTGSDAKAKPNIITKDAPKPGILAKIGGQEITEEELIGDDKMDFFDLKKREYELRMDRVNRLMVERLMGAEAKKANMTTDEYVNKKCVGGEIKISDKEFKKFVAEKKIPESQLNPQIKERINNYLQQTKRQELIDGCVAKLTKGQPVEVYFTKPKMQVHVDVGNAPIMGKKDAPVQIVEFSDFQCPFCSRGAEIIGAVKKKYGSKVAVSFKHFPLPMHKDARPGAEAAMCVFEQNPDKFWKYHDLLFKNQNKMGAEDLVGYAKEVGVDDKKFKECVGSKKFAEAIQKDMDQGEKVGVKSTPTFFVNGQLVSGAVPIEQFSEVIDEELAAK